MEKLYKKITNAVKAHYKVKEDAIMIEISVLSFLEPLTLPEPHILHSGKEIIISPNVFFQGKKKSVNFQKNFRHSTIIYGMKIKYNNKVEDYEIIELGNIIRKIPTTDD